MAAPMQTNVAGILHMLDAPTLDHIIGHLAISPCARANQLGNANHHWFMKWHFHKKMINTPMIISGLDNLAQSRDNARLTAMHILVDALEEYTDLQPNQRRNWPLVNAASYSSEFGRLT